MCIIRFTVFSLRRETIDNVRHAIVYYYQKNCLQVLYGYLFAKRVPHMCGGYNNNNNNVFCIQSGLVSLSYR